MSEKEERVQATSPVSPGEAPAPGQAAPRAPSFEPRRLPPVESPAVPPPAFGRELGPLPESSRCLTLPATLTKLWAWYWEQRASLLVERGRGTVVALRKVEDADTDVGEVEVSVVPGTTMDDVQAWLDGQGPRGYLILCVGKETSLKLGLNCIQDLGDGSLFSMQFVGLTLPNRVGGVMENTVVDTGAGNTFVLDANRMDLKRATSNCVIGGYSSISHDNVPGMAFDNVEVHVFGKKLRQVPRLMFRLDPLVFWALCCHVARDSLPPFYDSIGQAFTVPFSAYFAGRFPEFECLSPWLSATEYKEPTEEQMQVLSVFQVQHRIAGNVQGLLGQDYLRQVHFVQDCGVATITDP